MNKNNEKLLKAITMLIERSKPINDYNDLCIYNDGIEETVFGSDEISERRYKDYCSDKKELLEGRDEKEIYKYACQEYSEITSLLFN